MIDIILKTRCEEPAPLVVNGGGFVGCTKDRGHDGQHEVRVNWGQNAQSDNGGRT